MATKKTRVLHIGNIANNAYINAKLLNAAGMDCDVLCHDYYHIMGCPEWEDADFDPSLIQDHNNPNWKQFNLGSFNRPDWFVQGSFHSCIRHLIARRRKHLPAKTKPETFFLLVYLLGRVIGRYLTNIIRRSLKIMHRWVVLCFRTLGIRQSYIYNTSVYKLLYNSASFQLKLWKKFLLFVFKKRTTTFATTAVEDFDRFFPNWPSRLGVKDMVGYLCVIPALQRLFQYYDIVIGYGLDGVYPLLAENHPYCAYEHGTIRSIPFEDTPQGRLCALTYRKANMTFITNADNQLAAQKLGISSYTFIPHPLNESSVISEDVSALREKLQKQLRSNFVVFHPSRQHWEAQRHPSWEKGNDIFIHGFARFVKETNPKAGAVFVEWGQTVEKTRELLKKMGIADRVMWIPPQPNLKMANYIRACNVVADQFYLGAFGSTLPKALFHGTPAMLYVNERIHRWCFPEMPPVMNTQTPEEVFLELSKLYKNPAYLKDLVEKGKRWYDQYHSNEVIARQFKDVFTQLLTSQPAITRG